MGRAHGSGEGEDTDRDRKFFVGVARAFGGAVFFSLPLLMTMEMWWLGFHMDRNRLALFMVVMIPVLVGLDHYSGFEETTTWAEDVLDGMIGYGVGFIAAGAILTLLNVIDPSLPAGEVIGKICLQAVPAAFGAVLAASQFAHQEEDEGAGRDEDRREPTRYAAQLFFMGAGAVFLAFNVAPTEEVVLLAAMATPWHGAALAIASMMMMHGFVYGAMFRGRPSVPEGTPGWSLFLRFTVVGYALALLISAYVLWTFGRFQEGAFATWTVQIIVLAFPASIGAAAARLVL